MHVSILFFKPIVRALALLLIISSSACSRFLDVPPPDTRVMAAHVFSSDYMASTSISGLYSRLGGTTSGIMAGDVTEYGGLLSDELINFYSELSRDEFASNSLVPDNGVVSSIWTGVYGHLFHVNTNLVGLQQATGVTESLKRQYIGEMLLMRAFLHFYLVNFYGPVPLMTTLDLEDNLRKSRDPEDKVYASILDDLKTAKTLLQNEYPSVEKARPNRWTAVALLARVYLYREDWGNAEKEADELIRLGGYQLESPELVFLKNSRETIWNMINTLPSYHTSEGYLFIPAASLPTSSYFFRPGLLNAFEEDDLRAKHWIDKKVTEHDTYHYPFKYKRRVRGGESVEEHYVVLRLAEQYLIRAEARARLRNTTDALKDINIIRQRAGLDDIVAGSPEEAMTALMAERQRELFAEWGHRWFDLKRTGQAGTVLGPIKPGWKNTAVLLPVPNGQILLSASLLKQNEGYE